MYLLQMEIVESILNNLKNVKESATLHLSCLEGLSNKCNVTMNKLILSQLYCVQFGLRDTFTECGQNNAFVFHLVTDLDCIVANVPRLGHSSRLIGKCSTKKKISSVLTTIVGNTRSSKRNQHSLFSSPFYSTMAFASNSFALTKSSGFKIRSLRLEIKP